MAASDKTPGLAHFPKPPRSSFKPTCTHVTMVRAYGATCQNCNRKSPLGWVWQCACDEGDDPWTIIATHQSAAAACDPADPISKMKALTLNQSVIDQAESGLYTPEQIERLISQKQQVMHVINSQSPDKAAEGDVRPSTRKPSFLANVSFKDFRAKSQSPSETAVAKERARHMRTVHPRCRYKCCQACRADFRVSSAVRSDMEIWSIHPDPSYTCPHVCSHPEEPPSFLRSCPLCVPSLMLSFRPAPSSPSTQCSAGK